MILPAREHLKASSPNAIFLCFSWDYVHWLQKTSNVQIRSGFECSDYFKMTKPLLYDKTDFRERPMVKGALVIYDTGKLECARMMKSKTLQCIGRAWKMNCTWVEYFDSHKQG